MRKSIVILFTISAIEVANPFSVFAQTKSYNQYTGGSVAVGSVILNLGAGIGANYREDYYYSPFGLKAALEFGLWQAGPGVVTLGPELGSSFSSDNYYGSYNHYRSSTFVMAARSAWHYGWKVPGLDTYAGVSLGIGIHHYDYYTSDNSYNSYNEAIPAPGVFVGASYFFTPHFGFNAETGYDITNFQLGVVFKMK